MRYLEHLSYPALESEPALENERSQREGAYFHRLAQQSLLGLEAEVLGRLANTPDLERWWQSFLENRPDLDGYTIYTEHVLTAPLGKVRLLAKYDLLALKDGCALIYDWKTARKRPTNEWLAARWQTRVYMALLAKCGGLLRGGEGLSPENIQMLYWFAEAPAKMAVFRYSAGQLQRDWDVLCSIAEEMGCAPEYPQTEDEKKCGYCVYRSYCNRGVRAAEGMEGEGEMLEAARFDVDLEQIGEIAF